MKRYFSLLIAVIFTAFTLCPPAIAQSVANLPQPGIMVPASVPFQPVLLKGIKVFPDNPFKFDFVIDRGDANLSEAELKEESAKLVRYFLAALTVAEEDLWVNLSPYEGDRVISPSLGQTELGRDMLAQDYLLKQLTASLMYPEEEPGQSFWDKVYQRAYERYGTTDIPLNTFNKVWILPEWAKVYEKGQVAYVVDGHLRVLLDEDYTAMKANENNPDFQTDRLTSESMEDVSLLSAEVVREILIPAIEEEINHGKNFAPLRQMFYGQVLATWYKTRLKNSLISQMYANRGKTEGVDVEDPDVMNQIYDQYVEAFKAGVYDYIKEDYDPVMGDYVPRKYFSGGITGLAPDGLIGAAGPFEGQEVPKDFSRRIVPVEFANVPELSFSPTISTGRNPSGLASPGNLNLSPLSSGATPAAGNLSIATIELQYTDGRRNRQSNDAVGPIIAQIYREQSGLPAAQATRRINAAQMGFGDLELPYQNVQARMSGENLSLELPDGQMVPLSLAPANLSSSDITGALASLQNNLSLLSNPVRVLQDSRFENHAHAGRARQTAYVATLDKAAHESAELFLWRGFVESNRAELEAGGYISSGLPVLEMDIGEVMQRWANDLTVSDDVRLDRQNRLVAFDFYAHERGQEAEHAARGEAYTPKSMLQAPRLTRAVANFDVSINANPQSSSAGNISLNEAPYIRRYLHEWGNVIGQQLMGMDLALQSPQINAGAAAQLRDIVATYREKFEDMNKALVVNPAGYESQMRVFEGFRDFTLTAFDGVPLETMSLPPQIEAGIRELREAANNIDLRLADKPDLHRDIKIASVINEVVEAAPNRSGIRVDPSLRNTAAVVKVDPYRLKQVLRNLAKNAFEETGATELRVDSEIDWEAGEALVRFSDNGRGISQDVLEKINRGESVTTKETGSGIGLPLSRELVQNMGGSLTAANAPEGGAVFNVRLPLRTFDRYDMEVMNGSGQFYNRLGNNITNLTTYTQILAESVESELVSSTLNEIANGLVSIWRDERPKITEAVGSEHIIAFRDTQNRLSGLLNRLENMLSRVPDDQQGKSQLVQQIHNVRPFVERGLRKRSSRIHLTAIADPYVYLTTELSSPASQLSNLRVEFARSGQLPEGKSVDADTVRFSEGVSSLLKYLNGVSPAGQAVRVNLSANESEYVIRVVTDNPRFRQMDIERALGKERFYYNEPAGFLATAQRMTEFHPHAAFDYEVTENQAIFTMRYAIDSQRRLRPPVDVVAPELVPLMQTEIDRVASWLSSGAEAQPFREVVLFGGSGVGRFEAELAQQRTDVAVIVSDVYDPQADEEGRYEPARNFHMRQLPTQRLAERQENIATVKADVMSLIRSAADGSLDKVVLIAPDHAMVTEIIGLAIDGTLKRKLKPDGELYIRPVLNASDTVIREASVQDGGVLFQTVSDGTLFGISTRDDAYTDWSSSMSLYRWSNSEPIQNELLDQQSASRRVDELRESLFAQLPTQYGDSVPGSASDTVGGIDFNPSRMDLTIDSEEAPINFQLDPALLQNLQFDGFTPVIINIQPLPNLPQFLGAAETPAEPQLSKSF